MKVLETPRLVLRRFTLDDVDALHAVIGDGYAMRFYQREFSRQDARAWILRNLKRYDQRGTGLWAVTLKGTGLVIGDCGITIQMIDGRPEEEIGYHLQRWHWGKGYATEAARACRDYIFEVLGRNRVVSWMTPDNIPSRRVAERVGMKLEKTAINILGTQSVVYSMSRADYESKISPQGTQRRN